MARNFPPSTNHANSTATARATRPTTTTGVTPFGFPLLTPAPGLPGTAPAGAVPGTSAPAIAAGTLAATAAPIASARASTHRTARASAAAGDTAVHGNGSHETQIERLLPTIEHVVPGAVWVALGVSLALAALGGTAALLATRRIRRNAGQFAAVTAAALTDPLTGILNRRGFLEAFDRELARARRYGRQFVLAYVDVQGLKAVNDSEGHLAGDELLKSAAVLLSESARADDVVGRIGGDEMALLLVEQGPEGAGAVIRRIVDEVPARRAAMGLRSNWDLTIGTASFPKDGSSATELLAAADRRLYEQRGIALR